MVPSPGRGFALGLFGPVSMPEALHKRHLFPNPDHMTSGAQTPSRGDAHLGPAGDGKAGRFLLQDLGFASLRSTLRAVYLCVRFPDPKTLE